MSEMIRKVDYYYTTTSDKPGEGTQLLTALRQAGVGLLALHGFPSARKAQIDFVPTDPAAFVAAAKSAKIKLSKAKTAFLVEGDDRIGVCAGMGRYGAILWVKPRDVKKAATALGAM